MQKYSSLLIAGKPLGSRCIFIFEVINTADMVVLMGSLLLLVNHVLCSGQPWVCSVMELSGTVSRNPCHGQHSGCLACQGPLVAASPFPPGIWLSGDTHNFVCPVLCYRTFSLHCLESPPTSAHQDLKGDKLLPLPLLLDAN